MMATKGTSPEDWLLRTIDDGTESDVNTMAGP
jgi:hypothetical protein